MYCTTFVIPYVFCIKYSLIAQLLESDTPKTASTDRTHMVKALERLAGLSGLYPQALNLRVPQHITWLCSRSVADGSFGEVYRARSKSLQLAVKRLKVSEQSDMQKVVKVRMHQYQHHWDRSTHRCYLIDLWQRGDNLE